MIMALLRRDDKVYVYERIKPATVLLLQIVFCDKSKMISACNKCHRTPVTKAAVRIGCASYCLAIWQS